MKFAPFLLFLCLPAWSQQSAYPPDGVAAARYSRTADNNYQQGRLNKIELGLIELQNGIFHKSITVSSITFPDGTVQTSSVAVGNVFVSSGGVFVTGTIGSGGGHFRTDAGVEVQGTSAGYSCLETRNPGAVNSDECFLVFGAYDSAGATQKTMSISSKWADATATTGYGVLRFNATYLGGTQDDLFLQGFGNKGISVFGPDSITFPGNKIMKIYGRLNATNVDAGSVTVTGTSALGPLNVNASTQLSGNAYYSARFQDLTGTKGVNIGFDNSTTVGIISSDQGNSGLSFWTHDGVGFGEKIRISSGGNVGFLTSNPTRPIDVSTNNPIIQLERTANTGIGVIEYVTNGTQDWIAGERDTADSDYHLFSFGTGADVITARRTGNVGIGITSPGANFDVNGNAQFGNAANKSVFSTLGSLTVPYGVTASSFNATNGITASTATLTGNAFSVGGSSFTVNMSTVAIGGSYFSVGGSTLIVNGGYISQGTPCGNLFTRVGIGICLDTDGVQELLVSSNATVGAGFQTVDSVTLSTTQAHVAILRVRARMLQDGSAEANNTSCFLRQTGGGGAASGNSLAALVDANLASERSAMISLAVVVLDANKDFDFSSSLNNAAVSSSACDFYLVGFIE